MAQIRLSGMCALWPWPWRYDLESRSWHTLGSWTSIVWNIIQIQHGSEDLWPGHGFWVCVHCDLDLGGMTLNQGYDTPLGHGQPLCEILSRSNMAVKSYCPDTEFGYVCTVTLTLEVWPWIKVMTHPWVMDNNCVKYYPDPTWQWGVIARIRILGMCALWPWPWRYDIGSRSWHILGSWTIIVWNIIQIGQGVKKLWPEHDVNRRTYRQTDGQTDRVIPIYPQNFVCGGIMKEAGWIRGQVQRWSQERQQLKSLVMALCATSHEED